VFRSPLYDVSRSRTGFSESEQVMANNDGAGGCFGMLFGLALLVGLLYCAAYIVGCGLKAGFAG
jgi:hypothetical protein